VTGHPIPARKGPRRSGDASRLVARTERAQEVLGWQPRYTDIEEIVATAWGWHRSHRSGYSSQRREP